MAVLTPETLVAHLRGATLQVRTGVLLAPVSTLSSGPDLSAQLSIDWVDLVRWKLEHLVPGSRYLGINASSLLRDLDTLVNEPHMTTCLLVGNADVLLARLPYDERQEVWEYLRGSFRKRPTGAILWLPEEAANVFPARERARWEATGRVARLILGGESATWRSALAT